MSQLLEQNARALGELFSSQEYTGRGQAHTSRLDSTGNPEADPSAELSAGYIWVRRIGGRASSRALISPRLRGWERIANLLVEVGLNRGGELVAIEPVTSTETAITYGNALSTAPAQAMYIETQQFAPGAVTADRDGGYGLGVYVQPIPYGSRVIRGRVDVTASVPTNAGERRLAVIYYDISANALGVADGDVTPLLAPFTLNDVVAVSLGDTDRIRLAAVELAYGQVTVTESNKIIDARDWLTLAFSTTSTYDAIITDALGNVMVDALGNVMTGV